MIQIVSPITSLQEVKPNIWAMNLDCPEIALNVRAGQFINIKVSDNDAPLLRRPFSVYHVEGNEIKILFNVIGRGTNLLSSKRIGDLLDIIGPLGCSYKIGNDFEIALLVAGGIGVASLPLITSALKRSNKKVLTFLGAKSVVQLVPTYLDNLKIATDDGSAGFQGTVVDLLSSHLKLLGNAKLKIFACGPTAMLNRISMLSKDFNIPCEVSLESAMACGIGICQGCPVEQVGAEKKYALVCKDGPVFDVRKIRIG